MGPKSYTVLFAHGSSDYQWRLPFENLSKKLGLPLAYMEFHPPSLESVCQSIEKTDPGASIAIFPLFMSQGAHLQSDLPRIVDSVNKSCPSLKIQVLKPLGAQKKFWNAVEKIILENEP